MTLADDTPLSDEELDDLADAINGFDVRLALMVAERRQQVGPLASPSPSPSQAAARPGVTREDRDGCIVLRPTFPPR